MMSMSPTSPGFQCCILWQTLLMSGDDLYIAAVSSSNRGGRKVPAVSGEHLTILTSVEYKKRPIEAAMLEQNKRCRYGLPDRLVQDPFSCREL